MSFAPHLSAPSTLEPDWRSWRATLPEATRVPAADARALADYVGAGAALLAQLPARPQRTAPQQAVADAIHGASREARSRFVQLHADWIYDRLTDGKRRRPQLAGLAGLSHRAAELFPGLVPTSADIAVERLSLQADKEAREIDQGILFAALLAAPAAGPHLVESLLRPGARAQSLLAQFQRDGLLELATLRLERRDGAAHLTVNNQRCLNAEDDQLIEDMETAVDLALLDDGVRVCVLRGGVMSHPKYAGRRVFSAGINLKQLHQGQISFVDFLLRRELGYLNKMLRGLLVDVDGQSQPQQLAKPWISVVDTFAIGGGAQLLLVSDKVIGESGSFFSLPAAQEGIVPGVANLRLGRAVGTRMARQIILGGRRVQADEPDGGLLFDETVAPELLDAALADSIAALDSPAVMANKRMLVLAEEPFELFRQYMAAFALEQAYRMYSPDVLDKVSRA
ncbi:MAG: (3,5-dihydroxyphenyl)acetyl-CoA 1,2-dioxygenase DpgC [Duganella sp.]